MRNILLTVLLFCSMTQLIGKEYIVSNTSELETAAANLKSGDRLIMKDGIYKDIKLIVNASGIVGDSIIISAQNAGKVEFTGDAKVELRGSYIVFKDIYFRDGARNPKQWKSHGPGLVAIYGSHNRVSNCLFHRFDIAESAYITTSLDKEGNVPQYCRIDHCAFIEKTTFDQVINLNNTPRKSEEGEPGIAMYHRVDHCYFSNPQKKGNAGGGIRVGYWRKDFGRCLVDNNLFERQDSEAEIITSKSMENVYYNNTFINCRGTLNFRHGDKQVAINNLFLSTDKLFQYGGMYVWGSQHLIACNYFNLATTLRSRGSSALYLNMGTEGSEHALAFDITIARNLFADNNGSDINLSPMIEQRQKAFGDELAYPYNINFASNLFAYSKVIKNDKLQVFNDVFKTYGKQTWNNNLYSGKPTGLDVDKIEGLNKTELKGEVSITQFNKMTANKPIHISLESIEGIDLNFKELIAKGITSKPLTHKEVGPTWCKTLPGIYAQKGEWSSEVQAQFDAIGVK